MRTPAHLEPLDLSDFSEEIRRLFSELGRTFGADALSGECTPPVDLYETDEAIEIRVDLPGVDLAAVRVFVKGSALLVAGEKAPRRGRGDSSFHLVERGFGRFARVVRLPAACDPSHAVAALAHGELRITLPKIADRRGRAIVIPVS